jgi:hypothetical protein
MIRESVWRVFRENRTAVSDDVEHATLAADDLGVNAQLPRDGGRQPGGLRQVVSADAVANPNLHDSFHHTVRSRPLCNQGHTSDRL